MSESDGIYPPKPERWISLTDHEAAIVTLHSDYEDAANDTIAIDRRVRALEAERDRLIEQVEEHKRGLSAFHGVIEYMLGDCRHDGPMEFLRCWNEGDFDAIRDEWPDAPEEIFYAENPVDVPAEQEKQEETQSVWIKTIDQMPKDKQTIQMIGVGVPVGSSRGYTTDQYCGWLQDGAWKRWPHSFDPTHWHPVQPPPNKL